MDLERHHGSTLHMVVLGDCRDSWESYVKQLDMILISPFPFGAFMFVGAKPPPPAVFRGTQLRKFQVKFRDMLTLEPEDCCASGLEKILGDSGKAFAHVVLPCSVFP